jgi:hypothetical protein
MKIDHVFLQAEKKSARGVAADAAINDGFAGKILIEMPAADDGITDENDFALVGGALGPEFFSKVGHPTEKADRACAGPGGFVVGSGVGGRAGVLCGQDSGGGKEGCEGEEEESRDDVGGFHG